MTKWGNSLGIHIPLTLADKAHIKDGVFVDIDVNDEVIIIRRKAYSLEELLAQVTANNLHIEINTGKPMGKEAW